MLRMSIPVFAQDKTNANTNKLSKSSASPHKKFTYKIIDVDDNTFGYDIYADGNLMIHQNTIPAIPGNKGFRTKAQAEKVATLVIHKIRAGKMPPSVDIEELKKLKAI
jgi:hypothetical protein